MIESTNNITTLSDSSLLYSDMSKLIRLKEKELQEVITINTITTTFTMIIFIIITTTTNTIKGS